MKKLSMLFLAVCVLLAVGCANEVTKINNITDSDLRAMKTIAEAGGTPDSSAEGIADFLSASDYQGVFATEGGYVGYKIKDSKIYDLEQLDDRNDIWVEITDGISVDKTLNKLEYQTESGLVVLTFDGFGYRYYIQGEESSIKYYKKYDYLEPFAGTWQDTADNANKYTVKLAINPDGCITRFGGEGILNWGRYTSQVILQGDTLTFKGADRSVVKFDLANGTATYNGDIELKKQQ